MLILYQVQAPHFVAGLVVEKESDMVVQPAPILAWARNKKLNRSYFASKDWRIIEVEKGA